MNCNYASTFLINVFHVDCVLLHIKFAHLGPSPCLVAVSHGHDDVLLGPQAPHSVAVEAESQVSRGWSH